MARKPSLFPLLDALETQQNWQRCTVPERGVYISALVLLGNSPEYGILRDWTALDVAAAVGCPLNLVNELIRKGMLLTEVALPFHVVAKRDARVLAIDPDGGSMIFCPLLVEDAVTCGLRQPVTMADDAATEVAVCDTSPVIVQLLLNDNSFFDVTANIIASWANFYPGIPDIEQQFRDMAGWCMSADRQRKTKTGIKRFINRWLAKEQDKAGQVPAGGFSDRRNAMMDQVYRAAGVGNGRVYEGCGQVVG